jgi:hypothetical protein
MVEYSIACLVHVNAVATPRVTDDHRSIRNDCLTSSFAARLNGRAKPGRPADSLDLRHRPVLSLSSMIGVTHERSS